MCQKLVNSILIAVILLISLSCSKEDVEITEIPLGPAPNERVTGSFKFNQSNFKSQTNATSCNPSVKDNNAHFLSMKSTILYNGNVGTGTVFIVLPNDNIKSMEYNIVALDPIDLNGKPNNAMVYFFLNTSAPGGGGDNIEGYATDGKLWVDAANNNIIARFEDITLKAKKDGSGAEVGTLSGAIDCSEKP
ncbi:MAG: hypothetical protein ACOCXH_07805 [Cyclobacteriaceae bacterium]